MEAASTSIAGTPCRSRCGWERYLLQPAQLCRLPLKGSFQLLFSLACGCPLLL